MKNFLDFKRAEISQALNLYYGAYNLKYSQFRMRYVNWDQKRVRQQKLINDHIIEIQNEYIQEHQKKRTQMPEESKEESHTIGAEEKEAAARIDESCKMNLKMARIPEEIEES